MNTPPLESLFRVFRRTERSGLAAAPASQVARLTAAARVADDARAGTGPWPLEPEAGGSRGREDSTALPARSDSRAPPDGSAAGSASRAMLPALLATSSRATADGFAQGGRETPQASVAGARDAPAPVRARERDDDPAALLTARARSAVAAGPRAADAYHAPRDAAPRISLSGQLVSDLLPEPARTSSGGVVRAAEPLLGAPPLRTETLAHALHDSIARSGLFYESHLADWTLHRGSFDALAREPQAQWWAAASASAAFTMAAGAADASALPAPLENVAALRHLRMQLETLESGRVQWQGEVWPRQPAHVAIEAEGWSCGSPDPVAAVWRSRLTLELPHLGVVEAELVLSGASLAVRVHPDSRLAEAKLRAARDEIEGALDARFAASTVTVTHVKAE